MKQFKNTLLKISDEPMYKQKEMLLTEFENWRGSLRQLDDILIIGIQIQDDYGDIDFF